MADKPLILLHGAIKSPPFSANARMQAGFLLRQLQKGIRLAMPDSRPMPSIGPRCHELRIPDPETGMTWRVIYRLDPDGVLVAEVFAKKTRQTPKNVIEVCKRRFKRYDDLW
jgi:phage-related protein